MIVTDVSEVLTASERISSCFGIKAAKSLTIRPLSAATLSVVHFDHSYEQDGHSVFLPPDDAFLVLLYLVDVDHSDLWPDRPPDPVRRYPKGSMCLVSLKDGAAISVRGRFEALAFHIPRAHLAELAEEAREPCVADLATCRGYDDHVIRNIGAALMPMFDMPDEVRDTLLPHVGLAFNAHLAHRYGRSPAQRLSAAGLLSPMQETRVKTYIAANLWGDPPIDEIAEATGFSVDELCSGFLATTGQSVFEWISASRISKAQTQLAGTGDTIARVAATCGFADEPTFVESFKKAVGTTPADWRLRNRH